MASEFDRSLSGQLRQELRFASAAVRSPLLAWPALRLVAQLCDALSGTRSATSRSPLHNELSLLSHLHREPPSQNLLSPLVQRLAQAEESGSSTGPSFGTFARLKIANFDQFLLLIVFFHSVFLRWFH